MHPRLLCLGALAVLATCGPRERAVLVAVSSVPAAAQVLRATATLAGTPAREGPIEIASGAGTLTLGLPRDARGELSVTVEALDGARCAVARGAAQLSVGEGADALALAVPLSPQAGCGAPPSVDLTLGLAGRLRLLGASNLRSVAIADLDGDGHLDLVASHGDEGAIGVHLSDVGGLPAAAPTRVLVGPNPGNVVLADVTGDGRPDLIAVVRGSAAVAVAVNEGGGRFATPRLFRAGTDPRDVAAGDMDGDGRADLVVADYSGAVGVLRSLGGGDLDAAQLATADLGAVAVRLSDRNGDKRLDAVVVSERSNSAALFLNDGMGRLSAGARVALGRSDARSMAIADVDGDGVDDLLVGHDLGAAVADQLTLARGQVDGSFLSGVVVTGSGRSIYGLQVADIDNDRRRDVVVASLTDHKLTVLRGLSNGTLQSQNAVYAGHDPMGLAVGDLDGDGFNDVAIANQLGGFVSVLRGRLQNMADPLNPPLRVDGNYAVGLAPGAIAAADLDRDADGRLDLAVPCTNSNELRVLIGAGNGILQSAPSVNTCAGPRAAAIADLTGDGKLELAISCSFANQVDLRLNQSTPGLLAFGMLQTGTVMKPSYMTFADLDGDGKQDLIVNVDTASPMNGQLQVLPGVGSGVLGPAMPINLPGGTQGVAVGDLDGDGKPEVLAAGAQGNQLYVRRNLSAAGRIEFGGVVSYAVGQAPQSVAVGDLDGDGRQDVVVINSGGDYSVLLGQAGGGLRALAPRRLPEGLAPWWGLLVDLNGDRKLDLVTAQRSTADVAISLGQGDGTFRLAQVYASGAAPSFVGTADLNGDGRPDLFVSNGQALVNAPASVSFNANSVTVLLSTPPPRTTN